MIILAFDDLLFGPFTEVEMAHDRMRCDGVDWPFTVTGDRYAFLREPPPGPLADHRWDGAAYVAKAPDPAATAAAADAKGLSRS